MTIEAVLFDVDGTLVDSNERHVETWLRVFAEADLPREAAAIREQIGKGGDLLVPALLPDLPEAAVTALGERHGTIFKRDHLAAVRAFPGAAELIAALHGAGVRVALASSASAAELDHYVTLLGVGDRLAATASADEAGTSKPAPDIFAVALDKLGVAPACAIAVGDTPYDMAAAGKAGIAAIGLTSGPFAAERLRAAGAIAVYADVAELLRRRAESPLRDG